MTSYIIFITSSLARRKDFFKNVVTLYTIQKVFHYSSFFTKWLWSESLREKWFGNKYDILKIFKFVNIYIYVKTQFQQYSHFQQYQNYINTKQTFQTKSDIKTSHLEIQNVFSEQNISDWKNFRSLNYAKLFKRKLVFLEKSLHPNRY